MFLKGVLAQTFEVIGPMRRNVIETFAFALGSRTWSLLSFPRQVLMIFEFVITKTFCLWSYHFAVRPFRVAPTEVQPVFAFF